MLHKFKTAARAFFILLVILFANLLVYTFLHESGHALMALSLGGTVTDFNVNFLNLSAHVNLQGDFSPAQNTWINISGAALPMLVWLIFILALPQHAAPVVQVCKIISTLIVVNTLLAWMILPILHLFNCAPPSDDVTQLLINSQAEPAGVALSATALYALGWHIAARQVGSFQQALSAILDMDIPPFPGQPMAILIAIGAVIVMLGSISIATCRDQRHVPAGFTLVKEVDLSTQVNSQEALVSFTLTQPERIGFLLRTQNINAHYLDVTIQKTAGDPLTLLHGENLSISDNMSETALMLNAGDYQIALTSKNATGMLTLYIKRP